MTYRISRSYRILAPSDQRCLIIELIAVRKRTVVFIVLWVAPDLPMKAVDLWQTADMLRTVGASADAIAHQVALERTVLVALRATTADATSRPRYASPSYAFRCWSRRVWRPRRVGRQQGEGKWRSVAALATGWSQCSKMQLHASPARSDQTIVTSRATVRPADRSRDPW